MLDEVIEVEESELPDLNDERMDKFAKELGQKYEYWEEARRSLTHEIWPACDRAFMAICDNNINFPALNLVDNGMLGKANIRTALISNRNQILSGLIPSDESWSECVSLNDSDDEASLRKTKNWLLDLAEKARVPQVMAKVVDQLTVRGTTGMGVKWKRTRRIRRIDKKLVRAGKIITEAMALEEQGDEPLPIGKGKYYQTVFNGPKFWVIDMYRLLLDPEPDDDDVESSGTIYVMFKNLQELKGAKDSKTGEALYDEKTCADLREYTYLEWYSENKHSCESTKIMGIDPSLESLDKFVPVYLFHKFIQTTSDGDVYVDKFFYIARSMTEGGWKVIRVQDNPSDFGHKPFYIAQCDQWLNVPYGTGQAEKSLRDLRALNLQSKLAQTASTLAVIPPYSYVGSVLKDGRKPKWTPGAGNEIIMRPGIGHEWLKAFPIDLQNIMFALQEQRFLAEEINAQTGVSSGAQNNNPTRSLAKERTATEVRQESQDGAISNDGLVFKLATEILEPAMQCAHDYGRQYSEDGAQYITKNPEGKPVAEKMSAEELDRERAVKVMGRRGLASKAHEINNLFEILKVLANPQAAQILANLPIILQEVLLKLVGRLGLMMKEEFRTPPEILAARTPQAKSAALQNALQDPEMRENLMHLIVQDPQAQQMINEMMEEVKANAIAEMKQHQAEVAKEAAHQNRVEKQTHETVSQLMADHALGGQHA